MIKTSRNHEAGVTLVELLAALIISALVVVFASRIFLSGNTQFVARKLESDRLSSLFLLKSIIQKNLELDVTRCEGGKLWLLVDGEEKELQAMLTVRIPAIQTAEFQCWEKTGDPVSLVKWTAGFQPVLVEYSVVAAISGSKDTLVGSWIK